MATGQTRQRSGHRREALTAASLLVAALVLTSTSALAAHAGTRESPVGSSSLRHDVAVSSSTSIVIDGRQHLGTVRRAVLGSDFLALDNGMGSFDPTTSSFYPSFLQQLGSEVYIGSLRFPGGAAAQTYQWRRAVGPQSLRTPNAIGPDSGPSGSGVGPDEFGALLGRTGAVGVVTVNFDTGTATQAANFVKYLTGQPGSSYFADLRVGYGRRSPYNVPWFEVGNEEYARSGWRLGQAVKVGGPPGACKTVATCEYIYGGSTLFTGQRLVRYANRTAAAAISTGRRGQHFYVAEPPVVPQSNSVFVGGHPWTQVSSLATAGPWARVYAFNHSTGEATFGNGVHGAIPPRGTVLTATYVSGPHAGFVGFYRAMKRANPNIHVCATDPTWAFIEAMGSSVPYDCLQDHLYVYPLKTATISAYETRVMLVPAHEEASVSSLQRQLFEATGRRVPVVVTEYGTGVNAGPNPNQYPYFLDSLDEALVNASQLQNWIELGLPVADRQLLSAELPAPDAIGGGLPGAAPFATTGAVVTPGPQTVVEPTGSYLELFAPFAGATALAATVAGNPVLASSSTLSTGDLSVTAAVKGGWAYALVVNRNPSASVTSSVSLKGLPAGPVVTGELLDGQSSLSYNTPADPNRVTTTAWYEQDLHGLLEMTFPAHSITLIRFSLQSS